jgi:hypothetical protein
VTFTADDTHDMGSADGGVTPLRPRTVYVGTSVEVGTVTATTAAGDIAAGNATNELLYDSSASSLYARNDPAVAPPNAASAGYHGNIASLDMVFSGDVASATAGHGTIFEGYRSGGTLGSKTATATGHTMAGLYGYTYDGAAYKFGSGITLFTDGASGTGDTPAGIRFWTTPDASSSAAVTATLDNAGVLALTESLEVGTTITATATGDVAFGDGTRELHWDASTGKLGLTYTGFHPSIGAAVSGQELWIVPSTNTGDEWRFTGVGDLIFYDGNSAEWRVDGDAGGQQYATNNGFYGFSSTAVNSPTLYAGISESGAPGNTLMSFSTAFNVEGPFLTTRYTEANTAGSGAPNVISANNESWTFFSNEGSAAQNYHTLPSAAAGKQYTWYAQDADGIRITADTADTITINGAVSSTAGYIETSAQHAWVHLVALNATEWVATGYGGQWSVYDGAASNPASQLYAEMYLSSASETTLTGATPAKAAGTTTAGDIRGFTHANNRLTYDGIATKSFMVTVTAGVSKAAGSTELCSVHIYKDGATVNAQVDRTVSSSDEGAVSVSAIVSLATDEYIEVWLNSAGDNMTWESGTVTISSVSTN